MHNQNAAQAYSNTTRAFQDPRELEATLLLKAAAQLQDIRENWEKKEENLENALYYNRKLWTILASSMAESENELPKPIKDNVASLGVFVMSHTLTVLANPEARKLDALITINREIAAGLNAKTT